MTKRDDECTEDEDGAEDELVENDEILGHGKHSAGGETERRQRQTEGACGVFLNNMPA